VGGRGTGHGRAWGDKFDQGRCNTKESNIGKTTRATRYPNGISPERCYDMTGNVWEWAASKFSEGPDRVVRGGSFNFHAGSCRSASHSGNGPGDLNGNLGFRLVLLPGQQGGAAQRSWARQ
jgi:formylglycine-generating enzyme required for sulfatase activity